VAVPRSRSGWRPRRGQIGRIRWAAAISAHGRAITPRHTRSGQLCFGAIIKNAHLSGSQVRRKGEPGQVWRPCIRASTSRRAFSVPYFARRPKRLRKRWALADVCCRPKSRAEGEDGLKSPCTVVKLRPIPKVSLYKIAHTVDLFRRRKSASRFEHCQSCAGD